MTRQSSRRTVRLEGQRGNIIVVLKLIVLLKDTVLVCEPRDSPPVVEQVGGSAGVFHLG